MRWYRRCCSKDIGERWAKVIITDVNIEGLKLVAKDINLHRSSAALIFQDVTSEIGWNEVLNFAIEKFGKIDILLNNAGISGNIKGWENVSFGPCSGSGRGWYRIFFLASSDSSYITRAELIIDGGLSIK